VSQSAANKGYLFENFRLFHLRDRRAQQVESHYHEFDKALVFYSGCVDYIIEGVNYSLSPGDVLFVPHNAIHRPIISPKSDYERAVLWIRPSFLESQSREDSRLDSCFTLSAERRACLYHPEAESLGRIKKLVAGIEKSVGESVSAAPYSRMLFSWSLWWSSTAVCWKQVRLRRVASTRR